MIKRRLFVIVCLLVFCLSMTGLVAAQEETPEPVDVNALLAEANGSYINGDYEGAITAAQAVLDVELGNLEAATILADSYRTLGDDVLAADAYTLVIELNSSSPDGYFYRALTAYRAGDYDDNEAILSDLNRALELDFSDRAWLYNVRGLTFQRMDNIDAALEDFASALEIAPNYSVVYSNRASLLGEALGRWADSMLDRKYVLEVVSPDDAGSFNNIAWAYVQIGHYQEALGYAQIALEMEPNEGNTIDTRGWAYLGLGDTDNAILDFERAIELGITYSYYGLGATYNALGDTQTAIDYLNLYVEAEGDDLDQGALDLLAELQGE